MSAILGVEPIMIDSALVCAALRKRYYWTNILGVTQPGDKGIMLGDIVVSPEEVPEHLWYDEPFIYNGDDKKVQCTLPHKGWHHNMKEVYNLNNKCNTILCDGDGGHRQKKVYQDGRCRRLMPVEYERLQTLPDGYTDCLSNSRRYTGVGNGWTIDIIAHIFSFLPEDWRK
jgi:DNA (cytosine-5)-methyltransferase 3A